MKRFRYEFRMWLATVLLDWMYEVLPKTGEGLVWIQHIASMSDRWKSGKESLIHFPAVDTRPPQ